MINKINNIQIKELIIVNNQHWKRGFICQLCCCYCIWSVGGVSVVMAVNVDVVVIFVEHWKGFSICQYGCNWVGCADI